MDLRLAHEQGKAAALEQFGIKEAAFWGDVGNSMKQFFIGEPTKFYNQARTGKLFAPGGLMRTAFIPRDPVTGLLMYGLPAFGAYQVAKAPAEVRGSGLGEVIGGTVGGMLGSPLGMVGMNAGASLLGGLGKSIGSGFDRKPKPQSFPSSHGSSLMPRRPLLSDSMSNVTGRQSV